MAVWEHLNVDKAHIGYAVVGVFASIFSLVSLFVKEKLYIGEATVAAIVGLIVGPHCLNWFAPTTWGNSDYITLEISRIVLCLQIFAVAVELPKKYMLKHWVSVFMLLVPVMTWGWLVVGAFVYVLIPGLNFSDGLTVAACITATDPVLAAAVVGKGKFAQRVPGHLRNLLSAESGCNDGMAFPFIFLGINLVIHAGKGGEIVKDWICVTILYECLLGCLIGVVIGYLGRHAIKYAERKSLIDRESFLAFYIVLALTCAGFGSMLGVDDLLVSFAAGAAFSWDGWFAKKTEETHVSTVIDLLLNLAYFVYFGAIIPWPQFNNSELGTDVWRLVILAFVVLFLRRIPAVLALKPIIPDIKSWREALFCGHFGPIGVGAVFAAILARGTLEGAHTLDATPLSSLPPESDPNFQLIAVIWPITTFLILASIIVHGSSVAVITLGKELHALSIQKSFTISNTGNGTSNWISRLPDLKTGGRSFSLHRIDTTMDGQLSQSATIETTGVLAKPAGGMERRKKKDKKKARRLGLRKNNQNEFEEKDSLTSEQIERERAAKAASFALGGARAQQSDKLPNVNEEGYAPGPRIGITPATTFNDAIVFPSESRHGPLQEESEAEEEEEAQEGGNEFESGEQYDLNRRPSNAYQAGDKLIIEDQHGEILESAKIISDLDSLKRHNTNASTISTSSLASPLKSMRKLSGGHSSTKYKAYKVNDNLIIENEDGEIYRRYKINSHGSKKHTQAQQRSRSSTLSKALSAVGIRTGVSDTDKERARIPPVIEEVVANEDADHEDESQEEYEDEDEDEDDEYDDHDDEYDDHDDELDDETEYEKVRRLTALGQVSAPRNDDDEEDDDIRGSNPRSR